MPTDARSDEVSNKYVSQVGYDSSVVALSLKNAFIVGAHNSDVGNIDELVTAFLAGIVWNRVERQRVENRIREVAGLGKAESKYLTLDMDIATHLWTVSHNLEAIGEADKEPDSE